MNELEKQQRIEYLKRQIEKNQAEIRRKLKEERLETYNIGEKIHKKQIAFHTSPKRMKAFFGGNRVGKTVAGAVEAVSHALGYSRFRPLEPSSGWVVSLTNDVQRDVAQKEILTWLPKKEIKDIIIRKGKKDDPENSIIDKIILRNGQTIGFKTCEQGREAFQGASLGWCIAEGQRVFMADGTYKPIEDVKAGDMVVTVNDHGDYVNKKVVAVHDKGIRNTIELQTGRFLNLQCTPDHKVYTSLKTKVEAEKADRIYQARMGWKPEEISNKEDAYYVWTGLVLSEGCVPQKKITMGAEDVVEKAITYLPSGAYVRKKTFNNGHVPDWFLNWEDFWDITDNKLAYEKSVPDWIFKSSNDKIALFLSYLYAGDGWATNHIIGYATTSKRLAEDVCLLLWRLGIRSSVSEKQQQDEKWRNQWWVTISSADYVKKFAEEVGIVGKEEAVTKVLAVAEGRKSRKSMQGWHKDGGITEESKKYYKKHNELAKNRYATIKNRKDVGEKHVYDLSIEGYHRFFVGTSLVSNCWFDEEPPLDVFQECQMRIIDQKGDIWFTMTPLKGLTWIYNLVYLNERNDPDIEYWMAEWEDNPWLSKEEIDKLIATMTEEEREARQYGRFTSLCGFAFPELRKEIHIVKPMQNIPEWYKRYVALDYGFDSLAVGWFWVNNYGKARCYRAIRKKNLIISEAAEAIKKFTGKEKIEAYYAPPDLWNRRQDTGKSAAQIFYENGILLYRVSNDREQGWLNVHEWLKPYEVRDEQTGEVYKTANLTFDEGLDPDLWKHLTTIQKNEKNPNDVATQPHDITHYPDMIRYFCSSRLLPTVQPINDDIDEAYYNDGKEEESYFGGEVTSEYLNYGG